jgi:hypothetical protein
MAGTTWEDALIRRMRYRDRTELLAYYVSVMLGGERRMTRSAALDARAAVDPEIAAGFAGARVMRQRPGREPPRGPRWNLWNG